MVASDRQLTIALVEGLSRLESRRLHQRIAAVESAAGDGHFVIPLLTEQVGEEVALGIGLL